ncbi:MAG: chromate resistance protein ChrB domain-containing protein [Nitrospirota bacterium]
MASTSREKWLLFFYTVPSKPVSNRMKIWRKLSQAGAFQLKGAVYILPATDEHVEFFQWLISEVTSMSGDGVFVRVTRVETVSDADIMELFNRQRAVEYRRIEKQLEDLDRRASSIRKGADGQGSKKVSEQFQKLLKEYDGVKKIDFFSSKTGETLKKRIRALEAEMKTLTGPETKARSIEAPHRRVEDYSGRTWTTRKRPFVDRMASAWLIKRFIDDKAVFLFIDEQDMQALGEDAVTFDIRGGEFTHVGDLCTFEALIKSFSLKAKLLPKIAEIVHELDMKDGKYENPETAGLEEILAGIRKTAKEDAEALEKGMAVFDMLYASKT